MVDLPCISSCIYLCIIKLCCFSSSENGFVEYDEFLTMMRRASTEQGSVNSDEARKREAFNVFDMDGNGYIDKHELKYVMRRLGENLSDEDLKAMFSEADLNGDGLIDYDGKFYVLLFYVSIFAAIFILIIGTDRPEQTVQTQIRRRILRRLIRVYTVCYSSNSFRHSNRQSNRRVYNLGQVW